MGPKRCINREVLNKTSTETGLFRSGVYYWGSPGSLITSSIIQQFPSKELFIKWAWTVVGKCVSPTFAMPHRGMASLASVGLDGKTVALGLLSVSQHTFRLPFKKRRRVEPRHARTTSGQGLLEEKERRVKGERGNSRRGFPSGDEAQALSLFLDNHLKWNAPHRHNRTCVFARGCDSITALAPRWVRGSPESCAVQGAFNPILFCE